jgi:hypothetical protein
LGFVVVRSALCRRLGGSEAAVAGSRPPTAGVLAAGLNGWPSVLAALGYVPKQRSKETFS